jgi:type II secretory pathway component PulF
MNTAGMLKSTQDRLERQEETQKQVDFFEKQKENLKNVSCGSVEEIAEKLKMYQSYEDQISSIKAAYNQEQMFHILDESTEKGEKIAEAIDNMEPKTPEERLEEMVEEALGIEDGGELEEAMEELEEVVEDLTEELTEELTEGMEEALPENAELSAEEVAEAAAAAEAAEQEAANAAGIPEGYMPFDVRL